MTDKVLVVTGGSRGIGRAVALRAARAGWRVCFSYVAAKDAAESLVREIEAAGGTALAVRSDVAVEADIPALFQAADGLGPLGGLVNNAGVVDHAARVEEMTFARLDRMMTTNVIGPFLCAGEAVRRMSTRHGGQGGVIVNVSSVAARLGAPNQYVDYAASKGAIDTLTTGLAGEVAGEGIRVNGVAPGLIETEIHASGGQPDRLARLGPTVPMKRAGTADEIAAAVLWLLSDEASYATGATLTISGGR
ncbi:sugar dehydrogenase [Methylobacterium indicum]|uniref:Glucose-1-dehydrogenase n=1 Tax=Methylobacterium indicum TaxID=1775910 RepID=A0A8H9C5W3_9HYPH|nr:SDR family oxidoreductase [Methylobacterium indicum]KTS23508.1 sugar dehydrogenase [Methylobacterium indicum]KTS40118.1 sugar dehydrogenase [Methylobacterium indicum]KTS52951.1 sugar dehydrogenase [Methylobacterium indicum]BCM83251.1 glucose-1-dehydrogenase [Methylobacterium indicum]